MLRRKILKFNRKRGYFYQSWKILPPMMPICRVRIRAGFWIYDFELGMVASYTASSFEVQKVEGSRECNKKISLIIENDNLCLHTHTRGSQDFVPLQPSQISITS